MSLNKITWNNQAVGGTRNMSAMLAGRLAGACLLIISVLFLPANAAAQGLVFVDLIGFERAELDANSKLPEHDLLPRVTLFYSGAKDDLRFLAEYVANDVQSHFGRVKAGWLLDPYNMVWLGRTHNPASYWRNQFHHGGWLQPSITRPGIAEFEVPGGIVPAHSTGLMYEAGAAVRDETGPAFTATFGYTSRLGNDGLEVPELINNNHGMHGTSLAFRLSYHFDEISGGNEAGLLASYNHIPNDMTPSYEIEQALLGGFVNWYAGKLRVISEFYAVRNELLEPLPAGESRENFYNAYVMVDYSMDSNWNIYSRLEDTSGEGDSLYLQNFSKFVSSRSMLGARYSIGRHNLIKFEVDRSERFSGDTYKQISLQWSFVYP